MHETTPLLRSETLRVGHAMSTIDLDTQPGTYGLTKLQDPAIVNDYRFLDTTTNYGNNEHVGTAFHGRFQLFCLIKSSFV